MAEDPRSWDTERLQATTRELYERFDRTGSLTLAEQFRACVWELERRGVTVRETLVFDGGPDVSELTVSDVEASILYWALEKLDAEIGLNEEEKPIFARIARWVGQPHGNQVEPEQVRDERV